MRHFFLFFIFIFTYSLFGYLPKEQGWQEIFGRNFANTERTAIYRAKVPAHWKRIDLEGSVADTMKPICEFHIEEKEKSSVKITIHNFPTFSADQRIPPSAQVQRWKQQSPAASPLDTSTTPISKGGFIGLFFEARSESHGILAWSMQIAEEHYRHLNALSKTSKNGAYYRQMGADYTIKAVGPNNFLQQNKNDIIHFAASFELIEAIPTQ